MQAAGGALRCVACGVWDLRLYDVSMERGWTSHMRVLQSVVEMVIVF
jgi:hypothetical protein